MKHSAKAAARLAREREKLDRRLAARGVSAARGASTARGVSAARRASAEPGRPAARLTTRAPEAGSLSGRGSSFGPLRTQLPYALVLAGIAAGLVLMEVAKDAVRGGTFVVAAALLAGSVTRLALPESRAGLLGSRRRLVDVAVLGALGVGLLVAGLIVQVPG
jgi:hypothetical protein